LRKFLTLNGIDLIPETSPSVFETKKHFSPFSFLVSIRDRVEDCRDGCRVGEFEVNSAIKLGAEKIDPFRDLAKILDSIHFVLFAEDQFKDGELFLEGWI